MLGRLGLTTTLVLTIGGSGCGGVITETLTAAPVDVTTLAAMVDLSAAPSFADERGGGLFIDLAGRVVRLRSDGTRAALESHPQNAVPPGPATSLWPLGPYSALVVTDRGLYVADAGWLIAPPWQTRLSASGFRSSAIAPDGVAWIAHDDGLFRIEGGELKELKANGNAITGITSLAIAPATDLRPGVWFAQGDTVSVAAQTAANTYSIRDSGLTAEELAGGVRGIAGITASRTSSGEVWVITPKVLYQRTLVSWRRYELGRTPKQVMSNGRFLWLQSGDGLYRYDADARMWTNAKGLEAVPRLLAVDAAGSAWVRVGGSTLSIAPTPALRLTGVYQNQVIHEPEAVVELVVPQRLMLESLSWRFDDGEPRTVDVTKGRAGAPPQQALTFHTLGGLEPSGRPKFISFGVLTDGLHTLEVSARTADGVDSKRLVHFDLEASAVVQVSWQRDIRPLSQARCDKCHSTGTQPDLSSYEQWKTFAAACANAVRDRRMPADGPLDAAGIQLVQRWVTGGSLP
ncbi:MAG: hypothetical protein JNJ54_31940 [Myxococcaceae bacterium]|nr:hypothetical protein [Myxococcaceae bacterium]